MKKTIAILLALVMAFGMAQSALADVTPFTPTAMNVLDYTSTEWLSSEVYRCVLTIFAMVDWNLEANTNDRYTFHAEDASYVVDAGDGMLMVYFSVTDSYTKDNDYVSVFYTPATSFAAYDYSDDVSPAVAAVGVAALGKTYYENDISTLNACAEYLAETLGS